MKKLGEEQVGAGYDCVECGGLETLVDHRPVCRRDGRIRPVAYQTQNTPRRPSDHSAKDGEHQSHFDSGMFVPRRQIEEPGAVRRAWERGQAFQPRYVSRLHQHQRSRAYKETCILSSAQNSI